MEDVKENKNIVTSYRLSQNTKDKLQQQFKDLGMIQEQYFNKVVSFMELEVVKENSFFSKDTTIIQCNLNAILNALISNKDVELELLKSKYKNMLSDKEKYITEQKQELQKVYSDLIALQKENEKNVDELMYIRIENNNQMEQLWRV